MNKYIIFEKDRAIESRFEVKNDENLFIRTSNIKVDLTDQEIIDAVNDGFETSILSRSRVLEEIALNGGGGTGGEARFKTNELLSTVSLGAHQSGDESLTLLTHDVLTDNYYNKAGVDGLTKFENDEIVSSYNVVNVTNSNNELMTAGDITAKIADVATGGTVDLSDYRLKSDSYNKTESSFLGGEVVNNYAIEPIINDSKILITGDATLQHYLRIQEFDEGVEGTKTPVYGYSTTQADFKINEAVEEINVSPAEFKGGELLVDYSLAPTTSAAEHAFIPTYDLIQEEFYDKIEANNNFYLKTEVDTITNVATSHGHKRLEDLLMFTTDGFQETFMSKAYTENQHYKKSEVNTKTEFKVRYDLDPITNQPFISTGTKRLEDFNVYVTDNSDLHLSSFAHSKASNDIRYLRWNKNPLIDGNGYGVTQEAFDTALAAIDDTSVQERLKEHEYEIQNLAGNEYTYIEQSNRKGITRIGGVSYPVITSDLIHFESDLPPQSTELPSYIEDYEFVELQALGHTEVTSDIVSPGTMSLTAFSEATYDYKKVADFDFRYSVFIKPGAGNERVVSIDFWSGDGTPFTQEVLDYFNSGGSFATRIYFVQKEHRPNFISFKDGGNTLTSTFGGVPSFSLSNTWQNINLSAFSGGTGEATKNIADIVSTGQWTSTNNEFYQKIDFHSIELNKPVVLNFDITADWSNNDVIELTMQIGNGTESITFPSVRAVGDNGTGALSMSYTVLNTDQVRLHGVVPRLRMRVGSITISSIAMTMTR